MKDLPSGYQNLNFIFTFKGSIKVKLSIITALLFITTLGFGQISPAQLLKNEHFKWVNEKISEEITIHYPTNSWANANIDKVKPAIARHFQETKSFIGIETYPHQIHLFIVSSSDEMKQLIGHETNGSAFYKSNTVTGIASKTINSIYANHELFHVMAMNV